MASVTRPKVDSAQPADLVEWTLAGRIRIPSFQRSYRWTRSDVVKLFDSIFRGYPIGNLLVWRRPATANNIQIGHLQINAPEYGDAFWIVDGQQRIISLVGAMTATANVSDPRFQIYFDLAKEKFVSLARNHLPLDDWMPVSIMLDTGAANSWLRDHPEFESAQIALAHRVLAALRDYRIPMYIVSGDDEPALRDIFDRMNTFGQSLRSEEVFNALNSVNNERQPSDLHTLADEVRTYGFGDFPERLLMQSLLAIRGARVDRDFRQEFTGNDDRHQAFIDTAKAIQVVVNFLTDNAGIPHIRLLPYSLYIPVLARFVSKFGAPEQRAAELLRRWIWRGAIVGVAPQGNTIAIRQGALAIHIDPVRSASKLLALLPGKRDGWEVDLTQIGLNRALARINILGLLSRQPRLIEPLHAEGSGLVDVLSLLDTGHVLVPIVEDDPKSAWGLANRMIYATGQAAAARKSLTAASADVLASHCMDTESIDYLAQGQTDKFLKRRASILQKTITDHVQNRALFGFRDGPDVADFFEFGEEDGK